jgi:Domain of unknown function (DUF4386)
MNSRVSAESWVVMERVREISPGLRARVAGVFYFLAVLTAVFAEFFAPGKLGFAAVLVPVSCSVVVTLLLYRLFKPVNKRLSLLAVVFNLVGLAFEALRSQPLGVNFGMMFHGLFCVLLGYLMFRSTFVPRILGALMTVAGLIWLIYLLPPLAERLSPYNTAVGLVGEGLPMLWLLVMGVNAQRWNDLSGAAEEQR